MRISSIRRSRSRGWRRSRRCCAAPRAAHRDGHLWTGQIVVEDRITHILVVTDAPDEVRAVDRAIGTELKRLKIGFAITGLARVLLPGVTPGGRVPKKAARSVGPSRTT